jgi:hypothetical protein
MRLDDIQLQNTRTDPSREVGERAGLEAGAIEQARTSIPVLSPLRPKRNTKQCLPTASDHVVPRHVLPVIGLPN